MFTLKFMQIGEDNSSRQDVVCCPHYEIVDTGTKKFVITYKDMLRNDGVERCIGEKLERTKDPENIHVDTGYQVCFIENSAGKTIDRINQHE